MVTLAHFFSIPELSLYYSYLLFFLSCFFFPCGETLLYYYDICPIVFAFMTSLDSRDSGSLFSYQRWVSIIIIIPELFQRLRRACLLEIYVNVFFVSGGRFGNFGSILQLQTCSKIIFVNFSFLLRVFSLQYGLTFLCMWRAFNILFQFIYFFLPAAGLDFRDFSSMFSRAQGGPIILFY